MQLKHHKDGKSIIMKLSFFVGSQCQNKQLIFLKTANYLGVVTKQSKILKLPLVLFVKKAYKTPNLLDKLVKS